jgi:hypothetical protein
MAQLFQPHFKATAAAKLFFYVSTTTTALTTYADAAAGTPSTTNGEGAIVADADGLFPAIFIAATTYKFVLKTAADATVLTVDSIPNTLSASSPVLTLPQINDTSSDHQYVFAVSELVADRTVTLPLLTGNDVFVFADFIQTLTNKKLQDSTTTIVDNADPTKAVRFEASSVTAGQTRVATWPDKNGTVAMTSDITGVAQSLIVALGDETTTITTGLAKVTLRAPYAMTITGVKGSLTTASSSGTPTFDINDGAGSILSTKLTIDANELTSTTAAIPAVISDTAIAADAEITIDIDVAGTGAKGAKIYIAHTTP